MKLHFWLSAVLSFCGIIEADSMQKPPLPKLEVPTVMNRRTIDCDGNVKNFPGDMMLINDKVLWCPTSKCATTTIFRRLSGETALPKGIRCYADHRKGYCDYPRLKTVALVSDEDLCKASTWVWVRNPWDRIASQYLDKIQTGLIDPWTTDPIPGIPPPSSPPTFAEFVRFIYAQYWQGAEKELKMKKNWKRLTNQSNMNRKWMPASYRCLAEQLENYDHVYKLEETFIDEISDMFVEAGFSRESQYQGEANALQAELYFYATEKADQNANYSLQARTQFYIDNADEISDKHELVRMIAETYSRDIASGNYTFAKWG